MKFSVVLFLLYISLKSSTAFLAATLAKEHHIDTRSQVFLSYPFGPIHEEDLRYGMGVLINARFVMASGYIISYYGPFDPKRRIIARIGCLNSFQNCLVRSVEWIQNPNEDIKQRRHYSYGIYLCRLSAPVDPIGGFSHMAFVPLTNYTVLGRKSARYQASGFHGSDINWVGHRLRKLMLKQVDNIHCNRAYGGVVDHTPEDLIVCATGLDKQPSTKNHMADAYDDGGGLYLEKTNQVYGLIVSTWDKKNRLMPAMSVRFPTFQSQTVQRLRAANRDFYADFPENIFDTQYRNSTKFDRM